MQCGPLEWSGYSPLSPYHRHFSNGAKIPAPLRSRAIKIFGPPAGESTMREELGGEHGVRGRGGCEGCVDKARLRTCCDWEICSDLVGRSILSGWVSKNSAYSMPLAQPSMMWLRLAVFLYCSTTPHSFLFPIRPRTHLKTFSPRSICSAHSPYRVDGDWSPGDGSDRVKVLSDFDLYVKKYEDASRDKVALGAAATRPGEKDGKDRIEMH